MQPCQIWLFFPRTEEEISAMQQELDKYGINMPAFGKIGGILANEVYWSSRCRPWQTIIANHIKFMEIFCMAKITTPRQIGPI